MSEALTWNPRRLAEGEQPTASYRRPEDAEVPACVATLAGIVGEERAERPSWQRRLALDPVTSELLLLLDVPALWFSPDSGQATVAPEPGEKLDKWLAFAPLAFPVDTAIRLLGCSENPELELRRRREVLRKRDEIRGAEAAKKKAAADAEAARAAEAQEREKKYREPDWQRLTETQRFVITLSLALEKDGPALAAMVRELAALQGGFLPLPRTQWWLPPEKRSGE